MRRASSCRSTQQAGFRCGRSAAWSAGTIWPVSLRSSLRRRAASRRCSPPITLWWKCSSRPLTANSRSISSAAIVIRRVNSPFVPIATTRPGPPSRGSVSCLTLTRYSLQVVYSQNPGRASLVVSLIVDGNLRNHRGRPRTAPVYALGIECGRQSKPASPSPFTSTSASLRCRTRSNASKCGAVEARCVSPEVILHAHVPSGPTTILVSTGPSPVSSAVTTMELSSLHAHAGDPATERRALIPRTIRAWTGPDRFNRPGTHRRPRRRRRTCGFVAGTAAVSRQATPSRSGTCRRPTTTRPHTVAGRGPGLYEAFGVSSNCAFR